MGSGHVEAPLDAFYNAGLHRKSGVWPPHSKRLRHRRWFTHRRIAPPAADTKKKILERRVCGGGRDVLSRVGAATRGGGGYLELGVGGGGGGGGRRGAGLFFALRQGGLVAALPLAC